MPEDADTEDRGKLDPDFHVDILLPDDYADFIAEVHYKNRFVLAISQEKGLDSAEVELGYDVRGLPERISLDGLERTIDFAKRRLKGLRNA